MPASDDAGAGDKADSGDASQSGGAPIPPARAVYLSPGDISTAVQASALELWVDGKQGNLGVATLQALAAAVSVVTWPELKTIAFDVKVVDASQAADMRAHISIAPAATLESRWYAVVGKSLPSGFEWWNAPGAGIEKVARFRTDSMPIIASVTRCDKGGVRSLSVHLSEKVPAADANGISVTGGSCEPVVGGAQTVDWAYLNCAVDDAADDLTLNFKDTATVRVDKDAWVNVSNGCVEFVPNQLAP